MVDTNFIKILESYITGNPGQRAKLIAKATQFDKSFISRTLHDSDKFSQDESYGWHVKGNKTDVLVLNSGWITAVSFEKSLNSCGCLVTSKVNNVKVIFAEGCNLMLDAGARLLFLLNYLILQKKNIEIDFTNSKKTLQYLNRAGFIDALDKKITIKPKRPKKSTADIHRGNSKTLVELASIDIDDYDESIPNNLTAKFNSITDNTYGGAAYNAFSELCNNVVEHSESNLGGIAGLQMYKGKNPHVQIVISDAGKGIVNTLRPALLENNSASFDVCKFTDSQLLVKAITQAGLSRLNKLPGDARGLGLSTGGSGLKDYGAVLSIRQEAMHMKLKLKDKKITIVNEKYNVPMLPGTHICLDFFID